METLIPSWERISLRDLVGHTRILHVESQLLPRQCPYLNLQLCHSSQPTSASETGSASFPLARALLPGQRLKSPPLVAGWFLMVVNGMHTRGCCDANRIAMLLILPIIFCTLGRPHHPPGTGTATSKSNGVKIKPLEDKYIWLISFPQRQRVPARHIKEKAQVASAPSSPVPLRDFLHHRQSWIWFHLTESHHAQGQKLFFSNLLLEANPS